MNIKRANLYLANLDPTVGSEINKTRPVVVVSNDINNKYSNTVTVLPITSNTASIYPFEVLLTIRTGNLPKESKVKADQIRTIDKARLVKEIGSLSIGIMNEIESALKIHLQL
jgi:mRNA interferase MazF